MASPATVDSIFASCSSLSDADRLRLLEELSVQVQIKPWDDGTSIPDYTSPAPSQSSRAISLSTQIRRALPGEVIGCPWCRRPVSVLPASSSLPKALGSSRAGRFAFVALIYGTACHKYFFGALVLTWMGPAEVCWRQSRASLDVYERRSTAICRSSDGSRMELPRDSLLEERCASSFS